MFVKKCSSCSNKIKNDFQYCPFCGDDLKSKYEKEDYGFLGRNDFDKKMDFSNGALEKMFDNLMKMFSKKMSDFNHIDNKKNQDMPGLNVQFFVNGEKVFPEKDSKKNPEKDFEKNIPQIGEFPKEKQKLISRLPKQEPKSRVKRISGKIVYEIYVPGVRKLEDVMINQLENSIEIRAIASDRVYSKNINLGLNILRYYLTNDSLVLEMRERQ